jgi:hypothetical protein
MDRDELRKAVREFRESLGSEYTQTKLALLLGAGMSTVQRYEQLVPPRGWALARYAEVAGQLEKPKYANIFRSALADELIQHLGKSKGFLTYQSVGKGNVRGFYVTTLESETEIRYAHAFTRLLDDLRTKGRKSAAKVILDRLCADQVKTTASPDVENLFEGFMGALKARSEQS